MTALDDAALSALDARLRVAADADAFSGVVRIERHGDPLFERAYGVASRRWGVPVRTSTRFDVASVTKLFTAVAVLQLVGEGRLGLDDRIHDHVDLAGTTIPREVTVRHLLTHTSGIADDADEEAGESYEALWVDRPSYSVTRTADFLPGFVHKEPNFPPGAGCRYCNVGFVLAGLVLEKVTGATYRDYVREHVFARAGMDRSGFFRMDEAEPDVAEGWEPVREGPEDEGPVTGWRQNIYSYPPVGSPDGGAHVTAGDLARFWTAVRGGELLPPDLTRAFLTPQVKHDDGDTDETDEKDAPGADRAASVHYGFGLEFELLADGSVRSAYKEGINTGSSAMLRHYPDPAAPTDATDALPPAGAPGVTVVVVSNGEAGAWDPVRQIDALVLG
ncbi:serine hydrolase domain-containing protein [Cellulosimicrobium cellulans]|uniref:serine hydrolase domain-containing protein n=1 Tax=Cellulosimicrobium cellulans TaxID=1710 RepID=UPI00240740F3|nr:serine hydrolase domain-containing protein [Cellulosimicrobium cellulans]MDF9875979.1 CubicO group peptidase (beta-lactamase class C family) [Cellulosimicrobium cellulans]